MEFGDLECCHSMKLSNRLSDGTGRWNQSSRSRGRPEWFHRWCGSLITTKSKENVASFWLDMRGMHQNAMHALRHAPIRKNGQSGKELSETVARSCPRLKHLIRNHFPCDRQHRDDTDQEAPRIPTITELRSLKIMGNQLTKEGLIDVKVDGKDTKIANPAYESWMATDQQVFGFILSSMKKDVLQQVTSCTSAASTWKILEDSYGSPTLHMCRQHRNHSCYHSKGYHERDLARHQNPHAK
ncbi:hypothetical protein EJB05_09643, partial [Eragrostis curvula]